MATEEEDPEHGASSRNPYLRPLLNGEAMRRAIDEAKKLPPEELMAQFEKYIPDGVVLYEEDED